MLVEHVILTLSLQSANQSGRNNCFEEKEMLRVVAIGSVISFNTSYSMIC